MTAGLTTHVLDTNREGPAEGVGVTLYRLDAGDREQVASATTNHDGRVDNPLLDADEIEAGTFELVFDVGAYYRETSTTSTFLDEVPVRFLIDDPTEHYHVPLLLSPGSYTTYRGS
jgi:5-hydroxyisourate hydrolase